MTDNWHWFEGVIEPLEWGRNTYTILRLPDDIMAALPVGTRRIEGEFGDVPVNLALTKAPVIDGTFVYTGKTFLRDNGLVVGDPFEARVRSVDPDLVEVPDDVMAAWRRAQFRLGRAVGGTAAVQIAPCQHSQKGRHPRQTHRKAYLGLMTQIPRAPLLLGLAGLIPFVWGAATVFSPALSGWGQQMLGPRFIGPYVQLFYGSVILSFMSGVLWGFATKADGAQAGMGYALSVIPALWAFFMTGGGPTSAALNLIIGFVGLLMLDFSFSRWGLTPPWWMQLRLLLTAIVVACLTLTVI